MKDSITTKIKRAFSWKWNLLALGTGAVFSFINPHPEIFFPLLLAGEFFYLGSIGLNPRFQKVLKGKKLYEEKLSQEVPSSQQKFSKIINNLDHESRDRFTRLCERCKMLFQLRDEMDSVNNSYSSTSNIKTESINKVLWLFLNMLHQRNSLNTFLSHTDQSKITKNLTKSQRKFETVKNNPKKTLLTNTLKDEIETIQERLQNYQVAQDQLDIINIELNKTEHKIKHICELGMTKQDSSDITNKIEGISTNIINTEKAMEDFSSGIEFNYETAPEILS